MTSVLSTDAGEIWGIRGQLGVMEIPVFQVSCPRGRRNCLLRGVQIPGWNARRPPGRFETRPGACGYCSRFTGTWCGGARAVTGLRDGAPRDSSRDDAPASPRSLGSSRRCPLDAQLCPGTAEVEQHAAHAVVPGHRECVQIPRGFRDRSGYRRFGLGRGAGEELPGPACREQPGGAASAQPSDVSAVGGFVEARILPRVRNREREQPGIRLSGDFERLRAVRGGASIRLPPVANVGWR